MEHVKRGKQAVVLADGLGEAEARVDDYVMDTGLTEVIDLEGQVAQNICADIGIVGKLLHRGGCAAGVHEDIRDAEFRHGVAHLRVEGASSYVVDDVDIELADHLPGNVGTESVDRDYGVWDAMADILECSGQTGILLVGGNLIGTWPRGESAYIENVGAVGQHGRGHSAAAANAPAPGIEAVGGGVDDTHHPGRREVHQTATKPYCIVPLSLHVAKLTLFLLILKKIANFASGLAISDATQPARLLYAARLYCLINNNSEMDLIKIAEQAFATPEKKVDDFGPGDTITVAYRIKEGNKERIQQYRGVVIKINGQGTKKRFTVRKISDGIGVERIFPMESPFIESITTNKLGKVRRAKLYYLRNLTGKKARIKERYAKKA